MGRTPDGNTGGVRPPVLSQVNLVVGDMAATLTFYRRLGWTIGTPTAEHAVAELPNGLRVEFDRPDFAHVWDSSYEGALGGSTLLGLTTETRDEVDELFADLVAHAIARGNVRMTRSGDRALPSLRTRMAIRLG